MAVLETVKPATPPSNGAAPNGVAPAGNGAAAPDDGLRAKVSTKGAVSIYGLNARFPVTLYADQWATLARNMPRILTYVEQHRAELKTKPAAGASGGAEAL